MKKLFINILAIIISGYVFASDPNTFIDSAKQAYANSEFEKAVNYYEEILKSGYEAADIYYNLGNSYYKSNKLTLAIINYERALILNPADEEIQFNLNIARQYVVDKIEVLPRLFIYDWIDAFLNLFSSSNWAILSVISFVLLLILFLFYFFTNRVAVKKISFWFAILFLMISIVSFASASKQRKKLVDRKTAIVFSSSVTLKSSPDASGTDLFVLHEGTKVFLEDSVQNWVEIKLTDGNKGWLQANNIVIL